MRQKITSAATLWALLSATSLHAADMPEQYTLYCKGEKATGFNWRANDWVEVTFNEKDYIIMKSANNTCFEKINGEVQSLFGFMHTKDVCINIREAGEEYKPSMSGKCQEFYPDKPEITWKPYLKCENLFVRNFVTSFNGWFHRSSVHGDVANRTDYKDSLIIEVGKCSQIN
jgi:hypothetical protein